MLILPFKMNNEMYAFEIESIKEIIPVVEFQKLPASPEYIKGIINYRGSACPVIDLKYLLTGSESKLFLSTRIIIIEKNKNEQIFGFLAEQITETNYINEYDVQTLSEGLSNAAYISKILIYEGKIIQMLCPQKIFLDKLTIF